MVRDTKLKLHHSSVRLAFTLFVEVAIGDRASSTITVLVRPRLKTDEQGGVSNEVISFFLGAGSSSSDNIVVQARGVESSNDLLMSNGDGVAEGEIFIGASTATANNNKNAYIVGNKNVSVLTKITSITNANPDANGTAVPTGMSAIGQFTFAAAPHNNSKNGDNDVVIDGIVFNVKATNIVIDATSFTLHNKADSTKTASCQPHYLSGEAFTAANVSGAFTVLCNNLEASATDTEVDEGENGTFVLSASITNPSLNPAGSSVLQVSLENFNSIDSSFGVTGSHIRWKDDDQFTNAVFDWIDYPEATVQSTSYSS